jgi:hypothetical protein
MATTVVLVPVSVKVPDPEVMPRTNDPEPEKIPVLNTKLLRFSVPVVRLN